MDTTYNNNDDKASQVYILHFKQPYWGNARHYVGYTTIGANNRIEKHRKGQGSLLVNYAHNKLGIDFEVGAIFDCDNRVLARHLELKLKRGKNLKHHCEICNGQH